MALAELNVRLGVITRDFDRKLKKVERDLQASAQRISSLGSSLTSSISLPFAAFGAIAIKSAGDIEALRLALTSTMAAAGRSVSDTTKELEELRKVALAPGIDFEQAIKASVRLQSVGISAEDAREQIKQLANAVAAAGGTAQNLDSVTVQFAQMIAKGKVFTQDLKIIKENIPSIGKAMQSAFGTQSAEDLQALGVSAKDFIAGVTAEMAKAPRVASGIKNSIVNVLVGLQLAAARVGDEINKLFSVSGISDGILSAVNGAIDAFSSLSDSTKRIIIQLAGVAAAAGPLIFVFGKLFNLYAAIRTGVLAASNAIALLNAQNKVAEISLTGLSGAAKKAQVRFLALNAAQRTLLIGGIITAIAGLVIVFNELTRSMSDAERKQQALSEVTKQAAGETAVQRVTVERLTAILQDETSTLGQKERALKRLQEISPEYYGTLVLAKGQVEGLTDATNGYIDSLVRAAEAQAAQSKIGDIARRNLEIEQKINEERIKQEKAKSLRIDPTGGAKIIENRIAALEKEKKANDAVIRSLADMVVQKTAINKVNEETNPVDPVDPKKLEEAAKKADLYKKALASIAAVTQKGDVLGGDIISEQAKEIENQLERLLENGFKPNSREIEHLKGLLVGLRNETGKGFLSLNETQKALGVLDRISATIGEIAQKSNFNLVQIQPGTSLQDISLPSINLPKQIIEIDTSFAATKIKELEELHKLSIQAINKVQKERHEAEKQRLNDEKVNWQDVYQSAFSTVGSILGSIDSLQRDSTQRQLKGLKEGSAAREAIERESARKSKQIALFSAIINVAQGVTKALATYPPPFSFIQAALVGAAGAFQIGTIAAQPLAHGGVATKPTLALIGEYPGASSNPEIVTPENKLRSIFRENSQGANGELVARVSGGDLLFILDKATNRRGRIR